MKQTNDEKQMGKNSLIGISVERGTYGICDVRIISETKMAGKVYAGKITHELKHITWRDDIVDIDGESGSFGSGTVILIDQQKANEIIALNDSRKPTSEMIEAAKVKKEQDDQWFENRDKYMARRNG